MKISHACMNGSLVIGGLVVFKYGKAVVNSAADFQTVEGSETLASANAMWTDAMVALSLERNVTQVALSLSDPAPDAFLQLIENQRKLAINALPAKPEFTEQSILVLENVDRLRREVDGMLGVAEADRGLKRVKIFLLN